MSDIQERIHELTKKISGEMDAHLFESIVSLFHQGVLKHYVRSPRCNYDPSNFKMSIEAANGVRFEGREKMIELEKELATYKEVVKVLREATDSIGVMINGKAHDSDSVAALVVKWRGADKESLIETMVRDTEICREAEKKAAELLKEIENGTTTK